MKFKIAVLAIVFTLSLKVNGQDNFYYYQESKTWEFGPRIGFTTSIINSKGSPSLESGIKIGLVGGVFARYQLADQWAVHGNISFSTRGNKSTSSDIQNSNVDFSITPVRNIKYRMFKKDMTFDFFVGPGISFLTNAIDKVNTAVDVEQLQSSSEFNLVIGGSLPIKHFLLTATNRIGLTNLLDNPIMKSSWGSFTTEWSVAYRFK